MQLIIQALAPEAPWRCLRSTGMLRAMQGIYTCRFVMCVQIFLPLSLGFQI